MRDRMSVCGLVVLGLAVSTHAATLIVDPNGGAGYTEIQPAIDAAADGDTVLIKPGEYVITEPLNFNRLHDPANLASPPVKNIIVKSEGGAEVTKIRMAETPANPERASVAIFENGEADASMLQGLTLTGGMGTSYCLEGETCRTRGGGIFCRNGFPRLVECTVRGNSADEGGGVYYLGDASALSGIRRCTIVGNSAAWHGGGVYAISPGIVGEQARFPRLEDCAILYNSAQSGGAIFLGADSCLAIDHCTIAGNLGSGGGFGGVRSIHWQDGVLAVVVSDSIIWGNLHGSLDIADAASVRVTHSCIEGRLPIWPGEGNIDEDPRYCGWRGRVTVHVDPQSPAGGDGSPEHPLRDLPAALEGYDFALSAGSPCIGTSAAGAHMGAEVLGICNSPGGKARRIYLAPGTYECQWLDLQRHVSVEGAGEEETTLRGTVFGLRTGASLSNLTVTAGREGGIVIRGGDSPEVFRVTVTDNEGSDAGEYCGGIRAGSGAAPTLRECTVSDNWADFGAGVCCYGSTMLFDSCTIAANRGCCSGVAIYGVGASLTIVNSAIVGNKGGTLLDLSDCAATFRNCTLAENRAEQGGVILCHGTTSLETRFVNCVSWDNLENGLCGEASFCLADQDPLFRMSGQWDDSGTPGYYYDDLWIAGDYRLQPGSPCIDAGTSERAPAIDIEGNGRPCGTEVDIGAYEFGDCPPSSERFRRGDANVDLRVDLSDAILALMYLFKGRSAACLDAVDANDDGRLDLADAVGILAYLFAQARPLPAPFGACGIDRVSDDLDCATFTPCEGP